jgi:hypothetical protein
MSGRQTLRPRLHEQTERVETTLLREGGEGRNGFVLFHISMHIEVLDAGQDVATMRGHKPIMFSQCGMFA